MNPFLHCFRHYFGRFRMESILFWIVSVSLSLCLWKGAGEEVVARLMLAEILLLLVVVVRITAAEDLSRTTAGWNLRPVSAASLRGARAALLAAILVPMLALRAAVWQAAAHPGWKDWKEIAWLDLLPLLLAILGFALAFRCVRLLRAREATGLRLLILTPLVFAAVAYVRLPDPAATRLSSSRISGALPLSHAVVAAMPRGDYQIGDPGEQGWVPELVGKYPLRDETHRAGRMTIRLSGTRRSGNLLGVKIELRSPEVLPKQENLAFVVRYADGTFAGPSSLEGESRRTRLPFYQLYEREMNATYATPLSLPWSRIEPDGLLDQAEVVVLRMTREPYMQRLRKVDEKFVRLGIASLESIHARPESVRPWREWALKNGSQVGLFLTWPTWSDAAWANLVEPALLDYDIGALKWDLVERLKTEPRLGSVMAGKGWRDLVIPEFSARLADGRPLDSSSFSMLLGDPGFRWSSEATHNLVMLPNWDDNLKTILKERWEGEFNRAAEDAWKTSGGAAALVPASRELAAFAAAKGDAGALRFLARSDDTRRLKPLLPADIADPVEWLSQHAAALRFDPARRLYLADEK